MAIQRKTVKAHSVKAVEGDEGVVEAIVSVFGVVDYANERVRLGAFAKSLTNRMPKGVWGHDWLSPVARTEEARELAPGDPLLPESIRHLGGLYIKGRFNLATQRGREAYEDLKFGTIDEFSIGYSVLQHSLDAKGVKDLVELELFEWSPVVAGMNPATAVISVKARQLETKATFLGTYAEGDAICGAINELYYRLKWYALYDALYDSEVPLEERRALFAGALSEFGELALRVFDALISAEEPAAAEVMAAEIKRTCPQPQVKPAGVKGLIHTELSRQERRSAAKSLARKCLERKARSRELTSVRS